MVNHFLVEDERLLEHLIELVKESAHCDDEDDDGYAQVEFCSFNDRRIEEVKNEILSRINK